MNFFARELFADTVGSRFGGTARQQPSHSSQVVFISYSDQICPGLNRPLARVCMVPVVEL
jgi:hypothetical protein